MQKAAHQLGGYGLLFVLQIAPERVRIAETGLIIAPDPASPAADSSPSATPPKPAPASAVSGASIGLGDISYRIPAGWSEKKTEAAITLSFTGGDDSHPRDCSLVIVPGLAKSGSL